MPELPEVEIARRNLERWLGRARLTRVELLPRSFVGDAPAFARRLRGRTVRRVERRGKWLRLVLDGDVVLYAHLGMTGKFVLRPAAAPPERHERARLDSARRSVRFVDARRFGRLVGAVGEAAAPDAWRELGPDALTDGVDAARLYERLRGRKRSIKETLLDQSLVAGVGNIQAAEALWRARIHPARPASSLTPAEVRTLARAIEASIADTLAREDGPEITYVEEPGAANPFDVYGKEGEPCPRCGALLQRLVQGGRSTVFCPRCQPRRAARRKT